MRPRVRELLGAHRPDASQPFDGDGALEHHLVPLLVVEGDRPAPLAVEPFHGVDEMAVEGVAAHLAVGDDVEAGVLLQCERLVHGAILDPLECRGRERTCGALGAGGLEPVRAEQAADDVGAEGRRAIRRESGSHGKNLLIDVRRWSLTPGH